VAKVVYIAGCGRSGSTLLGQMLGDPDGWCSCGEVTRALWTDASCGCGRRVSDCDFWSRIAERVGRYPMRPRPLWPGGVRRGYVSDSSLWDGACIRWALRRGPDPASPQWRHARVVSDLYGAIAEDTGARVIVDSSKLATNAYLIATLTDVDLYVVHLVRDPRAVAYSFSRKKGADPTGRVNLQLMGPVRSSRQWLRRNAMIHLYLHRLPGDRCMQVRYEDFAADPRRVVRAIREFVGERGDDRFTSESTVLLDADHTVGGNPHRFETGATRIRPDVEWVAAMPAKARALATLPALPLMGRYGYPWRARAASGAADGPADAPVALGELDRAGHPVELP
jgi:hypothetical protein